jgi:hypothetical protein
VAGETITVTWQLTPGEDLLAQTLEIEAAEGLTPLGESASLFNPSTRTLSLPLKEQGQVSWQIAPTAAKDFTQPLWFWGRLLTDEKVTLETPLSIPVAEKFQVESSGGAVKTSQGLVAVNFPEKALPEPIWLQIRSPRSKTIASSLSCRPVEIIAESQKTGAALHLFQEAVSIAIQYKPEEITGDEASLTLFYYDDKAATWRPLASRVDRDSQILTGKSDHLSVFDFNMQNWEAALLPTLANFQVASFTGAASYSFPIQVPAGPGACSPPWH